MFCFVLTELSYLQNHFYFHEYKHNDTNIVFNDFKLDFFRSSCCMDAQTILLRVDLWFKKQYKLYMPIVVIHVTLEI